MISVGEINVHVSDFERGLRFWAEGLGLDVAEKEVREHSAHARLDFADGSPPIRIFWPVDPWHDGVRADYGSRPMIGFDITTTDFEDVLSRLLEYGGTRLNEIEVYGEMRFVLVADPDGNTFELVEVPEGE